MKKITKLLTAFIVMAMIVTTVSITALADGSYYVDNTYMVLKPGQTATIVVGADNAAGRVDWAGSGAVSASGYAFLDNGVATIEVTAEQMGTGYITVTPTDIATYDGEVLSNSYTIQIDVVGDEGGYVDGNNSVDNAAEETPQLPQQEEQPQEPDTEEEVSDEIQAPAAAGSVLSDGNDDYEELTEEERLYTYVNEQERYIIQYPIWLDEEGNEVWNEEVYNLDMLNGFERATVNYKGINVDCFQYRELLQVFVLKNLETDETGYYILKDGEGFEPLSYVSVNGKQYIVVEFPEDFQIPEGYQMVEMTLGSNTVHALKKIPEGEAAAPVSEPETAADEALEAEEELEEAVADTGNIVIDTRTKVMLKGYETVVSPGLDSADPTDDLYYIYCLVDGKTQLYSYDSGEGTLQRASIVVYNEIPTEPETVIVYETVTAPTEAAEPQQNNLTGIGWSNMQIQMKVLLVALAVAILLIIILIILFAVMSRKNKKKNKNDRYAYRNLPPRVSDRDALPTKDDDDEFFSYVKTEELDLKDL